MASVEWIRTGLAAAVFVWVAFAWHQHEAAERRERAHVEELIASWCAYQDDGLLGKEQLRKTSERERQLCEIGLRSTGLGGRGAQVSGSVDVNGTVDVSPP